MPQHYIEKTLPYQPDQLYALVADIEDYPNFLPWCEGARVIESQGDDVLLADLLIHFRGVRGKYTSRVHLNEEQKEISVELAQGPFKHLYQGWKFQKLKDGTRVIFDIDFKLRNILLEKVMDMMFDQACEHMMTAFKKRADALHGPQNV